MKKSDSSGFGMNFISNEFDILNKDKPPFEPSKPISSFPFYHNDHILFNKEKSLEIAKEEFGDSNQEFYNQYQFIESPLYQPL